MKKIDKFDKNIPTRNYFVVLVVSVLVIIITLYARAFYLSYKSYKSNDSYFTYKKVDEITKDDIDFILTESTNNIIYVGYNSQKMYLLERKLYRELEKNNLLDSVIYLNISNYLKNDEYLKILNNKFPNIEIYKAPQLIIIEKGVARESIIVNEELIKSKKIKEISERNQLN